MGKFITHSPYISPPNILAYPDRQVKEIAIDPSITDCLKAGTPLNAKGQVANDATAIGILLSDVHTCVGQKTGVVCIAGNIDLEKAEAYSGIHLSDACKSALVNINTPGAGSRMGGGSGVQSDWSVNDPNDPAYVKNRICYSYTDKSEFFSEQTVPFSEMGPFMSAKISAYFDREPIEGEKYTIRWDGTEYECYLIADSGAYIFGNLEIAGVGENTGEPFCCFLSNPATTIQIITTETTEEHTVSMCNFHIATKQIDEKYIPNITYKVVISGNDEDGFSANHTGEEIYLEYSKGKFVYAEYKGKVFYLTNNPSLNDGVSVFRQLNYYGGYTDRFAVEGFSVKADGSVVHKYALGALVMNSSTPRSTKKFKITVDDSGAITATEVT